LTAPVIAGNFTSSEWNIIGDRLRNWAKEWRGIGIEEIKWNLL